MWNSQWERECVVTSNRCHWFPHYDVHCDICAWSCLHASDLLTSAGRDKELDPWWSKCGHESSDHETKVSRQSDVSVDPLDHSLVNHVENIGFSIAHSINQLTPSITCERQFAPLLIAVYEMCPFITQKVEEFEQVAIELSNLTQQRVI